LYTRQEGIVTFSGIKLNTLPGLIVQPPEPKPVPEPKPIPAVTFSNMRTFWDNSTGENLLYFSYDFSTTGTVTTVGVGYTTRSGSVSTGTWYFFLESDSFTTSMSLIDHHWTVGETYEWYAVLNVDGYQIESPRLPVAYIRP
jgi:hypothetical protein